MRLNFFFQAEDGIRDYKVTGVQTCALPICPRPERPPFVHELSRKLPFYASRHSVKPGITGWAQVRYPYGASVDDAVQKLQFDLYYVKNHSLFLDLVILFQTAQVVLFRQGAR